MPYAKYLGPVWFRRFLLDLVPIKRVQRVKDVNDTITTRCKEIFQAKKAAIETGDQEAIHSIGEGKDLMSILRKSCLIREMCYFCSGADFCRPCVVQFART